VATTSALVTVVRDAALVHPAKLLPSPASLLDYLASIAAVVVVDDVVAILACPATSTTAVVGKVGATSLVDAPVAIHTNLNFYTLTTAVLATDLDLAFEPVCEHVWQLAV
jgi:hypothetical protein